MSVHEAIGLDATMNPMLKAKTRRQPFIIGVAGGTASGKTTVCEAIMEQLGQKALAQEKRRVEIIHQDSFYKVLTEEQKEEARQNNFNFDHPDAFDTDLVIQTVLKLKEGKAVDIPIYNFKTHSREEEVEHIAPPDVVLLEGILILFNDRLRDLMDMKLFVDTDSDIRLSRRVVRDIRDRGRDLEGILTQYMQFVKPAFDDYVFPTKKFADVIIPRGADNKVAIDLIVQHIRVFLSGELTKKDISQSVGNLRRTRSSSLFDDSSIRNLQSFDEVVRPH